jgi:uncharacterized protein YdbL (DUF1318 family)
MRLAVALVAAAVVAAPLGAQSSPTVAAARAAGQVGERYDGYLGFAVPPSPAIRQEVLAVNIKRRALYSNLARQRGVAPEDVGVTAGCELLNRVAVGEVYLLQDGAWHRRDPGEGVVRPSYCGG